MREHLKTIVFTAAISTTLGAMGYLWLLLASNVKSDIRQDERIETNADRITTIKEDGRVDEITTELRDIKQILNEKM